MNNYEVLPTIIKRRLLQDESRHQVYTLQSLKGLTTAIYKYLSHILLPIIEDDCKERLAVFNDIDQWMDVQRKYTVIADDSTRREREKFVVNNGLSKQIYYASVTKYRTNWEFITHCEECYLSLRRFAGNKDVKEVTPESYKEYCQLRLNYLTDSVQEIEAIKEKADCKLRAEFYIRVRIRDYLLHETNLRHEDIDEFKEHNQDLLQNADLKALEGQYKAKLKEIVDDDGALPEDFIKQVQEEEEAQGCFSNETVLQIAEITFEKLREPLNKLIRRGRQERRSIFEDLEKYLDKHEHHEKIIGQLTDRHRKILLKQWGLSVITWERSLERLEKDPEFCASMEGLFINALVDDSYSSKKLTLGDYIMFLDMQKEFLQIHCEEIRRMKKGLRPEIFKNILRTRIGDYVAIKCHIEVEDVIGFAMCRTDLIKRKDIQEKLGAVSQLMEETVNKSKKVETRERCQIF